MGGEAQHNLCDTVQLPQGGAGLEKVPWEGSGILDALSDPT